MAATTADYFILLSRAMESLPDSSAERRAEVYQSARQALVTQLEGMDPPVSRSRLRAEQRALDDAVETIETRAVAMQSDSAEHPAPPAAEDALISFSALLAAIPDSSVSTTEDDDAMAQSPFQSKFAPRAVEEKPMSRLDEINRVLRKLQSDSFGVEACALISEDGLMIASVLAADMEETRVAGMTATLLSLGGRAAMELGRSHLQEVIIRGESGYAVLVSAGRGALLLALTNENSKLGLTFFDMREAVRSLQKVL
ncbi:roadblock/LC7 domain-containing protein [Bradyrhizobium ontarionense]|uniref:Roadblock/LC7 domain-containing protein n=1 Tax=Bradyrhizobium ontarionense TaxID=2898149 RepID=A0ABY3R9H2_9BRAD|nr:roadblock/LC7 domain-containing protein [Bradyrhizobium sp. A19]UFZ03976.1 roadblock/LC7 domain-containing protein [Bradyrhizobium sp. A19]